MSDDPPQPHNNDPKTNLAQSAVARVLLGGAVLDPNEGLREEQASHSGLDGGKSMEEQRRLQTESHQVDRESRSGSPSVYHGSFHQSNISPDVYITSPPLSSGLKIWKCPMCDYCTNDKSNFRRHKRLHMRNNPASVLRCGKCDFSTALPRKIREHYIQDHGEDYGPPMPSVPEAVRIQTFGENHFGGRHMEIPHNQCGQPGMPVTGTIHTLLGAAPPSMQFGRAEPQLLANCVTQYRPYEVQPQRMPQENHMASDYLRSIVSNIITTHHTPRVPATSTITSSSFYLPPPVESSQGLSPLTHQFNSRPPQQEEPSAEEVKVKVEPVDCDGASDVSSSATPVCTSAPRHMEAQTTQSVAMEITPSSGDRNNEATPSGDNNLSNVNSSEAEGCRSETRPAAVDTCDNRSSIHIHDIRSAADSRDSRVLVQTRFPADNREQRMSVDPRLQTQSQTNNAVDSREQRPVVDASASSRLTVDLRDLRPVVDSRSGRATIDSRVVQSTIPREQRLVMEQNESRAMLDRRDIRSLVPVDAREHRADQLELRPTVDIQFTNLPIKTEMSTVGIQCALPVIKTETNLALDPYDRRRSRTFLVERSVQCELLSSGRHISSTRLTTESGSGDHSVRTPSKCTHCGVTFEDEVLFSIHIGCHSHTDPFVCNVCGKQCYNKYGFYSHIMRGHQL